jgi:hypothetical protein
MSSLDNDPLPKLVKPMNTTHMKIPAIYYLMLPIPVPWFHPQMRFSSQRTTWKLLLKASEFGGHIFSIDHVYSF